MDITVVALAFAAIFVVELPDKTFLATLVLSTKYRPIFVWLGVGAAFAVQTLIAVAIGVLLGGCGAWLGQAGTRRTSAARRREIRRLESETARLKTYAPAPTNEGPNGIYRNAPDRVALPAPH